MNAQAATMEAKTMENSKVGKTNGMNRGGEVAVAVAPQRKKHHANQRVGRTIGNIVVYLILIVMSVLWLLPILWLFLQSFSGDPGVVSLAKLSPTKWTWDNYYYLLTDQVLKVGAKKPTASFYNFFWRIATVGDPSGKPAGTFIPGAFIYTLIIAILVSVISTLFCLATSYAFSRLRFKGRTAMMKTILILGMFPGFLGLIVLYAMFKMIGLVGTTDQSSIGPMWALILIYSGGAGMGYYISKGFFDTISKQIDEAAMVDGATRFQIFYKITLPLSKPIVVYTILTSFMGPWAEYITASYMFPGGAQNYTYGNPMTVAVLLKDMLDTTSNQRTNYWKEFCAGAIIVAVPTSLLFIALQKNYVSGVTGGAVKG
jgi:arabinogalactan oligomer/maltooligosaccharide transport system permease protein